MADKLYAFNKPDSDYLHSTIPASGNNNVGQIPPQRFNLILGKTTSSGIAANSSGTVYYREPTSTGWADTTLEYTAYNQHQTQAVGNSAIVVLAPINGRWVVITELCS